MNSKKAGRVRFERLCSPEYQASESASVPFVFLVATGHMLDTIYIVSEANVVRRTDLIAPTTVWACRGSSDDYTQSGTRVAGPIPGLFAEQVVAGLKSLLEGLGYNVVVEHTADD